MTFQRESQRDLGYHVLYCAMIRPHLEYAQSIWSLHLLRDIDAIKNVQIRATKLVDGLNKLSYSERLRKLNLPTLVYRRLRGDLIEMYKHVNIYKPNTMAPSFQHRFRPSRRHEFQIHDPLPRDSIRGFRIPAIFGTTCHRKLSTQRV